MAIEKPVVHCSDDGVLEVKFFLNQEQGLRLFLGTLELLKDTAKQYYAVKAAKDAQTGKTSKIITPGVH